MELSKILVVGCGGFLGAAARYIVTVLSGKWMDGPFPLGTLLVNVAGGLLMGFLMQLSVQIGMPANVRLFLTTGILGGLTTFSTFSYETVSLFGQGRPVLAAVNIVISLTLALLGVCGGKAVAGLF